jgi:hypothetical protein
MITLPPGFDYMLLVNDLFAASLPFVVIGMMILVYTLIGKGIKKL